MNCANVFADINDNRIANIIRFIAFP